MRLAIRTDPHMAAIELIEEALRAHGSTGGKGSWTCPAHDDRNASLSVTNGDGRVLLHCHAGCSQEAVVAALDLGMGDLFDEPRRQDGRPPVVDTYDYVDEEGRPLFRVLRFADKSFRQQRYASGRWEWGLKDTRRVLFRLPQIISAVREGRRVFVCEGEKDVLALERAGQVATCNAMGAGKWRAEYSEHLRGAQVAIVCDRDEAGYAHAAAVARALRGIAQSVRVLEPAEGKDAHDHLAAGLGVEALVPHLADPEAPEPVEEAPSTWEPADLVALASQARTLAPPAILQTADGHALLYRGVRHMVSGEPETAKSFLLLASAAELMGQGELVVWIDTDAMGPTATLERLRALGASDEEIAGRFLYIAPDGPLDARGEEIVAELAARCPALVVIDAYNPALAMQGLKTASTEDVERMNRILVLPWQRAGAAVVILDHVVKDEEARGIWSYGSERKLGGIEVHLGLELGKKAPRLTRAQAATVTILAHKDRPGWHERRADRVIGSITFTPDQEAGMVSWSLTLDGKRTSDPEDTGRDTFRPTALMERVSRWIETQHHPASKKSIEDAVRGRAGFVRLALERLVEEGYVEVEQGPRGATLHRSLTPYRQAEDPAADSSTLQQDSRPRPTSSRPRPGRGDDLVPDDPHHSRGGSGDEVGVGRRTRSARPGRSREVSEEQLEAWEDLVAEGKQGAEE